MTDSSAKIVGDAIRRADELETAGDLAGAAQALSEAIASAPDAAKLHALYGRLEYLRKNFSNAIRSFDTALSLRPQAATTLYFRAKARSMIDDLDGALVDFQECARLQPQSADALYEMGMIREYRKEFREALELYEQAKRTVREAHVDFEDFHPPNDLDDRIASLRERLSEG